MGDLVQSFKNQINLPKVQETFKNIGNENLLKRFTAVTIRAVQENPALLNADRQSLFLACSRAAQDGLMPDNREGALVTYKGQVQWQPMILGLRKNLAKAGFSLRADIVREKDKFRYRSGDDPELYHAPDPFSKDRGPIIGAYAVARDNNTGEVYREVMSIEELEKVRKASRAANSPAWTQWLEEMYKKTVCKRLRKSLPVYDDTLLDLIDRDNEQFDLRSDEEKRVEEVKAAVLASAAEQEFEEDVLEGELVELKEEPIDEPPPEIKNPLDDF
jgi:recombination protein RecT